MIKVILTIYIRLCAALLFTLKILVNCTLRIKTINQNAFDQLKELNQPAIFVIWHQATFSLLPYFRKEKICILAAQGLRGDIIGLVSKWLGYKVLRISEKGKMADRIGDLMISLKCLKDGYGLGITVDGPAGPIYKMKPGSITLASRSGCPILPVTIRAESALKLTWRWDKYLIPMPFSKISIVFGDPIYLKENLTPEEVEQTRAKIEEKLKTLSAYVV
ncbi:MAG: lysophospholipid acyltransferase family protein [Candidatus Margulisbacteria bacterium]|nr:lysophospholipid acyltransferase family protein [Candidatus Margulisiibacteriota bacterium]MBU1021272.1 lysophospholipid acyltransferase family protein [Candidatus Margulisiibacteriota bacterium]MBU1729239.1 lysophospholipid acyltransferase family protein [Candidatus Margulisiibacteriota bacterium]MBU1954912.1 lysophospholipid acyltransferase family protein [Candidatus Margulisiibacteriota bacterium]